MTSGWRARARHTVGRVPGVRRLHAAAAAARDAWTAWPEAAGPEVTATIPPWPITDPEPAFPGLVSQACTESQIRTRAYRMWGERLKVRDVYVHRKQWEWFYIAQALAEAGVVGPDRTGLGFGVGEEPLAAWFAAQGCCLVATDYPGGDHAASWSASGELAASREDLNRQGICPPAEFDARVQYRKVDMRAIPDDLRDFDFAWSSCALEHLGSIDAGAAFVLAQLATLKPGGVAVHTTELNVSSEDRTVTEGPTVLFRRRDLEGLVERLAPHATAAPLNFNTGGYPSDLYVAPGALTHTHLKMRTGPYVTTSFGLIVRKAG